MRRRTLSVRRPRLVLGGVARNLTIVGGATLLGQGALVVAAPVLARLYTPLDFGTLSVYAALLSVLLAVGSLRFDFAIPIADDPGEAIHLLALSVALGLATSIVLGIVVQVWPEQISAAVGAPPLAPYLWILPIALFAACVAQALSSLAVYHRAFPAYGRMKAMQGLAQAVCQIALGLLGAGPFGLVIGDLAGRVFGTEQLVRSLSTTLRSTAPSIGAIGKYARARWGFARAMTVASVLNALALQVPFLLIPTLFGLDSSGQYFLAYRVLVLPASFVGAAFSQVFFGEAAFRRTDPRRLHDLAYNAAVSLFVFSIPTYAIIAVGGAALIEVLFGQQWKLAGEFTQVIAPYLILWSVASPISSLLLVGRRERESLAFTAAELGLKAGSLLIGAKLHSLMVGIVVLSIMELLLNTSALWRFLRVASVNLGELVRPVARIFALTSPSIALVVLVDELIPAGVLLASAIGWVVGFGLAARSSPELRALLSGSHD